jgi:hypothetical protein
MIPANPSSSPLNPEVGFDVGYPPSGSNWVPVFGTNPDTPRPGPIPLMVISVGPAPRSPIPGVGPGRHVA